MKKLAILGGAVVAGLMAFTPAKAGVSVAAASLLYADTAAPAVTEVHYKRRKFRRKVRRHHRRFNNYYYYDRRPHYRRSWSHYHPGRGYHRHPRRSGFGLNFYF